MLHTTVPWLRAATILVVAAALVTGCVDDTRPATCDDAAVTLELTLDEASLEPADPAVCRDQDVTLVVASSVDAIFHVHGYDSEVPAAPVAAGDTLRLEFTAARAGQFPIEIHPTSDPEGVEVGVLTVHER